MRQATVPQFIEVEDRIIGSITVRQFIIMTVCALIMFMEYKFSDMILFILLALPTFAVFGTISFLRINGMPFHYFILNVIQTFKKPKLRIWSREIQLELDRKKKFDESASIEIISPISKKVLTHSRLSDISLVVDTGGIYKGEAAEIGGFNNS